MKFALILFSLVLRAYMASGHAVSASHTMTVLQAYQAHLMRDLMMLLHWMQRLLVSCAEHQTLPSTLHAQIAAACEQWLLWIAIWASP